MRCFFVLCKSCLTLKSTRSQRGGQNQHTLKQAAFCRANQAAPTPYINSICSKPVQENAVLWRFRSFLFSRLYCTVLGTKQMCKTSIVDACVFFYRNNFSRHFQHADQISAALNGELPELWHFFGLIFLPLTEQCHRGFSLFESDGMLMGI